MVAYKYINNLHERQKSRTATCSLTSFIFQGLRPTCNDFINCEAEKYEDTTQKHLTGTMPDAFKEGTVSDVNLDDKEPLPK